MLGLSDTREGDQYDVYSKFKDQLVRKPEGYYETRFPRKQNHPYLPTNKQVSLRRLSGTLKKLERRDLLQEYHNVITQQLSEKYWNQHQNIQLEK